MGGAYHHNLISSVLALFSPAKLSGHGDEEISPARSAVAPQPRHRARHRAPATPPRPPPRSSSAGPSSSRSSGGPRLSPTPTTTGDALTCSSCASSDCRAQAPPPPRPRSGAVGHEASRTSSDYRAPATRRRPKARSAAPKPLRRRPPPTLGAPSRRQEVWPWCCEVRLSPSPPPRSARVAGGFRTRRRQGSHRAAARSPLASPAWSARATGQVLHGRRPSSPRPPAMFPLAAALGQAKMATLGARAGAGRTMLLLRRPQDHAAPPVAPQIRAASPPSRLHPAQARCQRPGGATMGEPEMLNVEYKYMNGIRVAHIVQ
nr:uncharacterized protein LOC127328849 [Lolium perenne]